MNQMEAKKQKIEYFSYVLGLISFMLFGTLIGNNGITYMAVIIECVSLFVVLVNGNSAGLIGRLLRTRRKKNQYKEAGELHKAFFLIQTIMAVLLMVIYFFLTDVLAGVVFKLPFLAAAMKFLTPIILLKTLQSFMLGYFLGMGAHMPSVVSSIFRQLLFLLFGLLLTGRLTKYGEKVSALLNNEDYTGMYGAIALCLAILISEIFITLFLFIVYIGSDRKREKQRTEDGLQRMESFTERLRLILLMSFPETAKNILKRLPFALGLFVVLFHAENISKTVHEFGVFYGYFICLCAIPLFIISGRIAYIMNRLTAARGKKDNRIVREVIYAGLHYSWAIGLYVSVCMAVLAPQLSKVIRKDFSEILQQYYTRGAAIIAVLVLNIFILSALYILGARKMTYILSAFMNVVFILSCVVLRSRELDTISVLTFAALIAGIVQLVVSFVYIVKRYVLQPDMIRGFLIPLAAAGAMGLSVMLVQNVLSPHVGSLMCLLLCLAFSAVIYMVVLVVTRSIKESEVNYVYGALMCRFFGMFIR